MSLTLSCTIYKIKYITEWYMNMDMVMKKLNLIKILTKQFNYTFFSNKTWIKSHLRRTHTYEGRILTKDVHLRKTYTYEWRSLTNDVHLRRSHTYNGNILTKDIQLRRTHTYEWQILTNDAHLRKTRTYEGHILIKAHNS